MVFWLSLYVVFDGLIHRWDSQEKANMELEENVKKQAALCCSLWPGKSEK